MSSKLLGWWRAGLLRTSLRRLEKLAARSALGLAALGAAHCAEAGQLFTGQFGTSNTWNVYEGINTPFTFKDALAFAAARPNPTGGAAVGHLVAIGSAEENAFVHTQSGGTDKWIGLTDRVGVAPGATEAFLDPTNGWAWVTGEPFTYQNWNGGEPNNAGAGEDGVHFTGAGLWNDNATGFGLDEPVADPLGGSTAEPGAYIGFVIEWSTNLPSQPAGFPSTRPDPGLRRVFPLGQRLPGPNGTASAWGVADFVGLGDLGNAYQALDRVVNWEALGATKIEGTAARLDIMDPDTSNNRVDAVPGPQVPIPSDNPGIDDDRFPEVVKGTINVPAGGGGAYTFNVHSDDGFAIRILSQKAGAGQPLVQHKFTATRSGGAYIDEDGALTFLGNTGDSNTQGTINLAPGKYDVEFVWWDQTGGAFAEVSTAKGDFVNGGSSIGAPQWLLLGSNETRAQVGPFKQPARLTGPATVTNFNSGASSIVDGVFIWRQGSPSTGTATANDIVFRGNAGSAPLGGAVDAGMHHYFPNAPTGMDINDFNTYVNGSFQVLDTDGAPGETMTFALLADDGAAMRIIGQDFTGVGGDTRAVISPMLGETGPNADDVWLIADYDTGNTNALGLITLPEGTYSLEAFQHEAGGGAALEVWVAQGDRLVSGLTSGAFFPLTTATLADRFLAANSGLALVAGPGTGPVTPPGDFDLDGDVDGNDFLVWQRGGSPSPLSAGDLAAWRTNFGSGGAGVGSAGAVPEPGSLCLVALAAGAGLCSLRGRRRG